MGLSLAASQKQHHSRAQTCCSAADRAASSSMPPLSSPPEHRVALRRDPSGCRGCPSSDCVCLLVRLSSELMAVSPGAPCEPQARLRCDLSVRYGRGAAHGGSLMRNRSSAPNLGWSTHAWGRDHTRLVSKQAYAHACLPKSAALPYRRSASCCSVIGLRPPDRDAHMRMWLQIPPLAEERSQCRCQQAPSVFKGGAGLAN